MLANTTHNGAPYDRNPLVVALVELVFGGSDLCWATGGALWVVHGSMPNHCSYLWADVLFGFLVGFLGSTCRVGHARTFADQTLFPQGLCTTVSLCTVAVTVFPRRHFPRVPLIMSSSTLSSIICFWPLMSRPSLVTWFSAQLMVCFSNMLSVTWSLVSSFLLFEGCEFTDHGGKFVMQCFNWSMHSHWFETAVIDEAREELSSSSLSLHGKLVLSFSSLSFDGEGVVSPFSSPLSSLLHTLRVPKTITQVWELLTAQLPWSVSGVGDS